VLNNIIWRAFNAAGIPATKEPSGLNRQDGKRPDGLTLIPWQGGKPLVWDVTVASTFAPSYADTVATGVGRVADQAANMKSAKYADFTTSYIFQPIAIENLAVAVLGKNIWGAGPSSFGRQQRLSEIYYRTN